MLEVIDDNGENYTYPIDNPRPLTGKCKGGKWIIIEDKNDILKNAFEQLGVSTK